MIHYHGTPITPRAKLLEHMLGRCFCVRYKEDRDLHVAHELGQSVMLDNGAYAFWRGTATLGTDGWRGYYQWAERWLDYQTTWAVIPDVIGGSEDDNDRLLVEWWGTRLPRGAPVWHMHESIDRLKRLCVGYERVCIGSSGTFADPGNLRWRRRLDEAFDALCGSGPAPTWLHMLRAMRETAGGPWPFASTDSTNVARNHSGSWKTRPRIMSVLATELDSRQTPARWHAAPLQLAMVTA